MKNLIKPIFKSFKYLFIFLTIFVSLKWIINVLPSSSVDDIEVRETINKESKIEISFKELEPKIKKRLNDCNKKINSHIDKEIEKFKEQSKINLIKEDGFLDWLFGWWTGYKLMYKKAKGLSGSEDNEKITIQNEFFSRVLNYNNELNKTIENINSYATNSINDFYKESFYDVKEHIELKIKEHNINRLSDKELSQIPWSQYTTKLGTDILEGTSFFATDSAIAIGIGTKVATILGPKTLGIISAKSVTIVASKVAASLGVIFAPIIDYALNEGVKAIEYDTTRKEFENIIDNITVAFKLKLNNTYSNQLNRVAKDVKNELNKKVLMEEKK
jgi:hypothetical protein